MTGHGRNGALVRRLRWRQAPHEAKRRQTARADCDRDLSRDGEPAQGAPARTTARQVGAAEMRKPAGAFLPLPLQHGWRALVLDRTAHVERRTFTRASRTRESLALCAVYRWRAGRYGGAGFP